MFYKEVKPCHSEEHEHRVRPSILREADVISHEGQGEGAGEGDGRRKGSCKQIEHGDGEGSEDQGDDPEVSFGLGERIKLMGEDEEERRMKEGRVFFIKFDLSFEIISGIIVGMDFVHPEGFFVEGVKSQGKAYKKADYYYCDFFVRYPVWFRRIRVHRPSALFFRNTKDRDSKRKRNIF